MTKPKKWKSARVCPDCGSKATKIFSLSTGKYTCQICDHKYYGPKHTIDEFDLADAMCSGAGR